MFLFSAFINISLPCFIAIFIFIKVSTTSIYKLMNYFYSHYNLTKYDYYNSTFGPNAIIGNKSTW